MSFAVRIWTSQHDRVSECNFYLNVICPWNAIWIKTFTVEELHDGLQGKKYFVLLIYMATVENNDRMKYSGAPLERTHL